MAQTVFVAKILIIDENDKFLLLRRSETHPRLAGFYDLPGGAIQTDEEPRQALIREVKEETGLIIKNQDINVLYATTQLIDGQSFPTLLYVCHINESEPRVLISWEHDWFEWSSMERLSEVEPQLAPTYREALHYISTNRIIEDIHQRRYQKITSVN